MNTNKRIFFIYILLFIIYKALGRMPLCVFVESKIIIIIKASNIPGMRCIKCTCVRRYVCIYMKNEKICILHKFYFIFESCVHIRTYIHTYFFPKVHCFLCVKPKKYHHHHVYTLTLYKYTHTFTEF